jgi:clan AA aspartic protease (TIGR02281 family)
MFLRATKLSLVVVLSALGGSVAWQGVSFLFRSAAPVSIASRAPEADGKALVVAGPGNVFLAEVLFNGVVTNAVIDTGASVTVLKHADAVRAGIRPAESDYTITVTGLKGDVKVADAVLESVVIGGIVERDLRVYVLPPKVPLPYNLLGQNFLSRIRVLIHADRMELAQAGGR